MKKTIVLMSMILLPAAVAMATDYSAITPGAGIVGSAHDLSSHGKAASVYGSNDQQKTYGTSGTLDRICVYCHAPHHTLKPSQMVGDIDYLPLWNHKTTTLNFTTYTNGTGQPATGSHKLQAAVGQPGGVSKLCLSCHDGSVAVNEYGFTPGDILSSNSGGAVIAPQYRIGGGGDLTNHHPIGFNYLNVAAGDNEIADPTTQFGTTGVTIAAVLYGDKMECVTCHDVHNSRNKGEKFLWVSDEHSNFCMTCHLKGKNGGSVGQDQQHPLNTTMPGKATPNP